MPRRLLRLLPLLPVIAAIAAGLRRVRRARRPNFVGIEDPEAVRAYNRISRTPQMRRLRHHFARHLAEYDAEGTVVDVGCGPGYLLALLADSSPAVRKAAVIALGALAKAHPSAEVLPALLPLLRDDDH